MQNTEVWHRQFATCLAKFSQMASEYEFLCTSGGGLMLQDGQHFPSINDMVTRLTIAQEPRTSKKDETTP